MSFLVGLRTYQHLCTVVLRFRERVCVYVCTRIRPSTSLNVCMAHTWTTIDTRLHWKHWIKIPVWRVAFTHLLLRSVSICYSWTQLFFLPWIGGLVAASFCGFVWTAITFSATEFLFLLSWIRLLISTGAILSNNSYFRPFLLLSPCYHYFLLSFNPSTWTLPLFRIHSYIFVDVSHS